MICKLFELTLTVFIKLGAVTMRRGYLLKDALEFEWLPYRLSIIIFICVFTTVQIVFYLREVV